MPHVANEERKNRRISISTSASKPIIFEPSVMKIPEYYQNICHEKLKCDELSN